MTASKARTSRARAILRQADLEKIFRAAVKAKVPIPEIQIDPDGTIHIRPVSIDSSEPENAYDAWKRSGFGPKPWPTE